MLDRALASVDCPPPQGDGAPGEVAVEQAMVDAPYTLAPDATLEDAAHRLCNLRVGCLPIVEKLPQGPRLVGLITETDLLGAAYRPT